MRVHEHLCLLGASSLFLLVCVGGQQLAVSDADTAPHELDFELVEAPIHGELMKTEGSIRTSMVNGEMIPQTGLQDQFYEPSYNHRPFFHRLQKRL